MLTHQGKVLGKPNMMMERMMYMRSKQARVCISWWKFFWTSCIVVMRKNKLRISLIIFIQLCIYNLNPDLKK